MRHVPAPTLLIALAMLYSSFRKLNVSNLLQPKRFTDQSIALLGRYVDYERSQRLRRSPRRGARADDASQMRELSLATCVGLTGQSLATLVRAFPDLTFLDLSATRLHDADFDQLMPGAHTSPVLHM